jgi:hypothetical protein
VNDLIIFIVGCFAALLSVVLPLLFVLTAENDDDV